MVALDLVHSSNAQLRELGPGLVALFGMLLSLYSPTAAADHQVLTTQQLERLRESENTQLKPS